MTGFATVEGVRRLLPSLRDTPAKLRRLVIGAGTQRAFDAVDALFDAGIARKRVRVHLGHSRHSGGTYEFYQYHPMLHSKVYLFDMGGGKSAAIIGSHHLTGFALGGLNGEAAVLLEGDVDDLEMAKVVDGLRSMGQDVHWITDDDSTVSTEKAQVDARTLMGECLRMYPEEKPNLRLSVVSEFTDNERQADLVAIPDLAAGAYSETLTKMGKANMPTSGCGPMGAALFVQIKSSLINAWRSDIDMPLKHMNAVIRPAPHGQMLVSFGAPFPRRLRPDESPEGALTLNAKWRRALEADLKTRGVDPTEVLKSMGIDV